MLFTYSRSFIQLSLWSTIVDKRKSKTKHNCMAKKSHDMVHELFRAFRPLINNYEKCYGHNFSSPSLSTLQPFSNTLFRTFKTILTRMWQIVTKIKKLFMALVFLNNYYYFLSNKWMREVETETPVRNWNSDDGFFFFFSFNFPEIRQWERIVCGFSLIY